VMEIKVRGRRYNFVVIDEYAFVPEDIIKLAIRPMLSVKHKNATINLYYLLQHIILGTISILSTFYIV